MLKNIERWKVKISKYIERKKDEELNMSYQKNLIENDQK